MKIALMFGKGIDGCGVTRGAHIFEKWAIDNGVAETIIVNFNNDQKIIRAKYTKWHGKIHHVYPSQTDVSEDILKIVNSCDIAIIHSYPTRKQAGKYIERFRRFLERVQDPIIVCHDHCITRINAANIPQGNELHSMADVFVTQSLSGAAAVDAITFDPGLRRRILENPIWIDPGSLDCFRTSVEDRQRHLIYIGRHSPIKNPAMLCRVRPHLCPDWEVSFIGCERSISSVSFPPGSKLETCRNPYIPQYQDAIKFLRLNAANKYVPRDKKQLDKNYNMVAYDTYQYNWGMQTLGSSFASWCGYSLSNPAEYGSRMEYTMIESMLLSMPIFNTSFLKNAFSPDGKLWSDYDFLLSANIGEELQLADTLTRMWENKKEWKERTAAIRELVGRFNSVDNLAPAYLSSIQKMGKRDNKVKGIDRISEYFPEAGNLRSGGIVVMSTSKSIKEKLPLILVNGKQEKYVARPSELSSFFV